ncbi:hypothetical protein RJ639_016093 [Escallonia herrerae]|uniref:Uncharacterized protein n=1 Tax=Escallonia herrerae TaxID=1293975 RepID=A0AA88VEP9_9ASTE|nr:hypothetical protein RJ639_016093 [Escallonia herrerae]
MSYLSLLSSSLKAPMLVIHLLAKDYKRILALRKLGKTRISCADLEGLGLIESIQQRSEIPSKISWPTLVLQTSKVESAKEWETLRNEFQGDDKVRAIKLQSLRKDLENIIMKEDERLKDYSSRFLKLINQMKTHDEDISDKRILEKTLISLPENFDPIVAVIEETKDLSTLSV